MVELANSLPADSVGSLTPQSGLLEAVEVVVEKDSDHPMTRLVIKTRSDAEHSVVADGQNLRIDLMPVAMAAPDQQASPAATEIAAEELEAPIVETEDPQMEAQPARTAAVGLSPARERARPATRQSPRRRRGDARPVGGPRTRARGAGERAVGSRSRE